MPKHRQVALRFSSVVGTHTVSTKGWKQCLHCGISAPHLGTALNVSKTVCLNQDCVSWATSTNGEFVLLVCCGYPLIDNCLMTNVGSHFQERLHLHYPVFPLQQNDVLLQPKLDSSAFHHQLRQLLLLHLNLVRLAGVLLLRGW